jgi:hypothetical protein
MICVSTLKFRQEISAKPVREAHGGIKPGVERAKRAKPQDLETAKSQPAKRAASRAITQRLANIFSMKRSISNRLSPASRATFNFWLLTWGSLCSPQALCCRPLRGLCTLRLPRLMLSSAPRTVFGDANKVRYTISFR